MNKTKTKNKIKIAPSILAADFSKLGEEIVAITKAGADYIHIDVMDGHFVPNLTIGPCVIEALRSKTKLPFDVHLMIENPELYIADYVKAGADIITVHSEACVHLERTLNLIKSYGKKAGVSLVPKTHENDLDYVMHVADLILVMTVNPGFGGQSFIENCLHKITKIRDKISKSGRDIELEVDGGINAKTAPLAIAAGANVLVAGSAIFKGNQKEYKKNIEMLR